MLSFVTTPRPVWSRALLAIVTGVGLGVVGAALRPATVTGAGRGFEPADHHALRSVSDVTFSPDGRALAYVER